MYLEEKFQDGSGGKKRQLIEKRSPLGRRFEVAKPSSGEKFGGDYFVLDSRGDLELRDDTGLISTATTIDTRNPSKAAAPERSDGAS